MPLCRLCSEDRSLVKAHIVPEAFFRVLRAEGETPLLVTNSGNHYPKRSPVGVYDQGILCETCESKFSKVDDYGIQVFLNRFEEIFRPLDRQGRLVAFEGRNVDQELLLRFLVATVWRASVSTHPYYGRVHLGPYESVAAKALSAPDEPISDIFSAVLSCWTTREERDYFSQGLMNPFREQWEDINAYRFYFGRVVAHIKVSNQQFSTPLKELALTRQQVLYLVVRDFDKSKDLSAMVRMAKELRARRKGDSTG
jgi:hypothetical protein